MKRGRPWIRNTSAQENQCFSSHKRQNQDFRNEENTYLPRYDLNQLSKLDPNVKFIDTHCHLDFLFNRNNFRDTYSAYRALPASNFPKCYEGCIAIFCDPSTFGIKFIWQDFLAESNVWGAFGCHPHNSDKYNDKIEENMKLALDHSKVVALGEIGLDYSNRNGCNHDVQKKVFRRQIQLALERKLPLIIHCRDASHDALSIMKEMVPKDYKIHRHCFTSDWTEAQEWMDNFPNLFLGFTPVVTYSSAREVHDVVRRIPLSRILLETDAPYFLPRMEDKQKRWSNPGMAIHAAAQIAAIRGIDLELILNHARENTRNMYSI